MGVRIPHGVQAISFNKKTYSKPIRINNLCQKQIKWFNSTLMSSVYWVIGQWASLLHLGCRGCEFESRLPNDLVKQ